MTGERHKTLVLKRFVKGRFHAADFRGRKAKRRKSNVGIDGVTAIALILWSVDFWIFHGDHNPSKTFDKSDMLYKSSFLSPKVALAIY
jgi:hypothetical protein